MQIIEKVTKLNQFFYLLGFKDGEEVLFILFAKVKKNIPPAHKFSRKLPLTQATLPITYEPYSLYFSVNGGGYKNTDITQCKAVWFEIDNSAISKQREVWKKLNLPKPSIQIFTGNKSLHQYYTLSHRIEEIHSWKDLMLDLAHLVDGDPQVCKPCQLMRVPLFPYANSEGKFKGDSLIVNMSPITYSYLELRNRIPERPPKNSANKAINDNKHFTELTLSEKRKLLDAISPYIPIKRDGEYEIYRELLCAVKNELDLDTALRCAEQWCQGSTVNWQQVVESSTGSFTFGTLIDFAKQHGYDPSKFKRENFNRLYEKSPSETNENEIIRLTQVLIDKLSQPEVSDVVRSNEIALFCSQYRTNPSTIWKAVKARIGEEINQDILGKLSDSVEDLMSVPKQELDLHYLLGEWLGTLFHDQAKKLPTRADTLFMAMCPMLVSLIGTRSQIVVRTEVKFFVKFILRMIIVAPSGKGKTPLLGSILSELIDLENELFKQYYKDLENWESEEVPDPKNKPKPPTLIFREITFEGLYKHLKNRPYGLLFREEILGYFNSIGQYSGGKGDAIQRDLELADGSAVSVSRQDDDREIRLPKTAVSMLGAIQNIMLPQIFNKKDDLSGVSGRWQFFCPELPDYSLLPRDDEPNLMFFQTIRTLIDYCRRFQGDLLLENSAYQELADWHEYEFKKEIKPQFSLPQAQIKCDKIVSLIILYSGIIHIISQQYNPDIISNPIKINKACMERGIYMGVNSLKHYNFALVSSSDSATDARILKALELLKKRGTLTVGQLKSSVWEFKSLSNEEIVQVMRDIISLGKGIIVKGSKSFKISSV